VPGPVRGDRRLDWLRRGAGLLLVVLATLPVYRLLAGRDTGLAGRATVDIADLQGALLWSGFLLAALAGSAAGVLTTRHGLTRILRRVAFLLDGSSPLPAAAAAGGIAFLVTLLFSWRVTALLPNHMDALVQLLHARFVAAGVLAADPELWGPHWHVQVSVLTEVGWVSHFPPGHVLLLGLGLAFGGVWAVGPILMAATGFLAVLIGDRLFPGNRALGRFGGLLVAVSPFLTAQAGTFMNHASAAAFGTGALYFGLRAREGARSWAWATGSGALVAAVLVIRPAAGVAFAAVIAGGMWLLRRDGRAGAYSPLPATGLREFSLRSAFAVLGGLPLLAGLFAYNTRFFGSPFRFGYRESFGESVGLGFGTDPWGNFYGPVEALAYTSADLTTLSLNLLETPVPAVVLIGIFLATARRLTDGERILALWAGLPVLVNLFYWHHGQFMGPRMLAEFAPGWILLTVASVAGLLRILPEEFSDQALFSPRAGFLGLVLAGLLGMAILAPQRLASYGGDWMASFRQAPPAVEDGALVFVHGSWESRLFALLATRGIPLDVVETALRQNPTCLVHRHMEALEERGPPFGEARPGSRGTLLPPLDLDRRAFAFEPRVEVGPGAPIRILPGEPLPPECARQIRADRLGVLDASRLVWLGDLPGIEVGGPMYLRDLGPERNRQILERYSDRPAVVYTFPGEGQPPRILDYDEGMTLLWEEG
jgi:hypothetical protein